MRKVKLTDITLRETSVGQESSLSFKEIIEAAKILDKLNLDTIALAPIENVKTDSLLVRTIASAVRTSALSIPVGYTEDSVDTAWEAVSNAVKPRLYVEAPISVVQMEFECNKKPESVLEMIDSLVRRSRSYCDDVEFAAKDATRSEEDFLIEAISTAIDAGAGTVTICDSAGTMLPDEFKHFIENLYEKAPSLRGVNLSVICSDEMSMAAACAVTAVMSGASEINVTVGGGSTPTLESAVNIIKNLGDGIGISCGIKTTVLHRSIGQMNWITRTERSKTSAFDTGFAVHHNDSVMLDANDDIGAVNKAVMRLGYDLSEEDQAKVYETFVNVAAKKSVGRKELEAIIASVALQVPPSYTIVSFVINSGNIINATANIHVRKDGADLFGLAVGDGPIDAAFMAIEQITGRHYELDDFQIQAVTEGREAMGSTLVKLRSNGKLYSGNGISTDIIGSSIRAYVNALNKIVYEESHS